MRVPVLFCLLLAIAFPASAMIFTTHDGKGAASIDKELDLREVSEDKVTINGDVARLRVGLSHEELTALLRRLAPLLRDFRAIGNANSVIIETPVGEDRLVRFYLLATGQRQRTLVFRMNLSRRTAERGGEAQWPAFLPRPPAAQIGTVMTFAGRDMTCAMFSLSLPPAAFTATYDTALRADGWQPVSNAEPDAGAMYTDAAMKCLLLVNAVSSATGTQAAVVVSPLGGVSGE